MFTIIPYELFYQINLLIIYISFSHFSFKNEKKKTQINERLVPNILEFSSVQASTSSQMQIINNIIRNGFTFHPHFNHFSL